MDKKLFGFYNRMTQCYDDFVVFESLDSLRNYYSAVYQIFLDRNNEDFQFADYILYPHDYTLVFLGDLKAVPNNPVDCVKFRYDDLGDFNDLIYNYKKESDKDVKRDSDAYDSEPVYSSQSPRS